MSKSFHPGRASPPPDEHLLTDPFELMLDSVGREALALRYDYIANILEEEFETAYLQFFSAGILHYEVINLVTLCSELLRSTGFPENEDSRFLRYNVIALIADYLNV